MKIPILNISKAIKTHANLIGGYAQLARKINELNSDHGSFPQIDRRKLKAIADGENFTVSARELATIDCYFAPLGEGFGDHPLFATHSLLEAVAENETLSVLIGAFQRNDDERNDVSLWDVKAFREVLEGLRKFRDAMQFSIVDVPFFNPKRKHNRVDHGIRELLAEPKTSICVVGSTRSNVAAEIVLADMFGTHPFVRSHVRLPFRFLDRLQTCVMHPQNWYQ